MATTKSSASSKNSSYEKSTSQSLTQNVLDEALRDEILAGLMGQMTDAEIAQFAENLLRPQLQAELEAAEQEYETTKLSKEQEIENIVSALTRSVEEQNAAYRQNMADVETAALARGMGRSSYTLETLANQGDALARAVQELTNESARQQAQIQQQITLAAQQKEQSVGRLNTDYASGLAAKIQELTQSQREAYNSNYLTAISAAMGQKTTGTSETTGTSTSKSSTTTTSGGGGSSSGSGQKTNTENVTVSVPKTGSGGASKMLMTIAHE